MSIVVKDIVYSKLPYLVKNTETDDKINFNRITICYQLQEQLEKEDADVEVENSYTKRQNLLIGYLVALQMFDTKALQNMAGTAGGTSEATQALKKAKADVVETEFYEVSSKNSLIMSASELKSSLTNEACQLARELEVALLICGDGCPEIPSFMIVQY